NTFEGIFTFIRRVVTRGCSLRSAIRRSDFFMAIWFATLTRRNSSEKARDFTACGGSVGYGDVGTLGGGVVHRQLQLVLAGRPTVGIGELKLADRRAVRGDVVRGVGKQRTRVGEQLHAQVDLRRLTGARDRDVDGILRLERGRRRSDLVLGVD